MNVGYVLPVDVASYALIFRNCLVIKMGRPTGLEPATPRFTILCSNQLSYDRRKVLKGHFRGQERGVSSACAARFFENEVEAGMATL